MSALRFEMRPSMRLLQQIAELERLAGSLVGLKSREIGAEVLTEQGEASPPEALGKLDPDLAQSLSSEAKTARTGATYRSDILAVKPSTTDLIELAQQLAQRLTDSQAEAAFKLLAPRLRQQPLSLIALNDTEAQQQALFPAISPFLIPGRLRELLSWFTEELQSGYQHPLLLIAVFHLALLQISPLKEGNLGLAILSTQRLLQLNSYAFLERQPFLEAMQENRQAYFSALRQAEKTAWESWSSLNVFLEFFLGVILEASREKAVTARRLPSAALTETQRRIIECIRLNGTATREHIVSETGINLSTVKYSLSVLASKGHLRRDGGGRSTSYTVLQ